MVKAELSTVPPAATAADCAIEKLVALSEQSIIEKVAFIEKTDG